MSNYFKLVTLAFLLVFTFYSCDTKKPSQVTSGKAQTHTTVFAKTCSTGSLKITKKTTGSVVAGASLKVDDLPVGDEVFISGTVANGAVCGWTGSVSFSCKATVRIGSNRTFQCIGENRVFGGTTTLGNTPYYGPTPPTFPNPSPSYPNATAYQRSLITGEFHPRYSGTKTFVSLTVSSSSAFVPASCKLSFICQ